MLIYIFLVVFIINYWNRKDPPVNDFISPLFTLTLAFFVGMCIKPQMREPFPSTSECELTIAMHFLSASLILNSIADFIISKENMKPAITIFSYGHIMMQLSYMTEYFDRILFLISITAAFALTCLFVLRLPYDFKKLFRNTSPSCYRSTDPNRQMQGAINHTKLESTINIYSLREQKSKESTELKFVIACYAIILLASFIQVSIALSSVSIGYVLFILSDLIIAYEVLFDKIYPRQIRVILVPALYLISQYILTKQLLVILN